MDRQHIDEPRRLDAREPLPPGPAATMTAERSPVPQLDEHELDGLARRRAARPAATRPARAAVGDLRLEVVSDADGLVALRPAWDELYAASGASSGAEFNPFTRWTWMWTWWRHHQPRSRFAQPSYALEVLVMRDRSEIVRSIVPFVRAQWGIGPLSFRALRMFGFGPCTTDLRSPMVWPGWEDAVGDLLARHLAGGSTTTHDLCVLDGLPATDPLTGRLRAWAGTTGWAWGPTVPSYTMHLPESWETFRRSLRGHIRKSVRHAYNGLARDGHEWMFDAITDPTEVRAAINTFLALHAARSKSERGPRHLDYYARPADRRMLRAIADELAPEGSFVVGRLRIGTAVVAVRLMLVADDAVYMYDAGSDLTWSRYAVATTLTAECLRWAMARGIEWAHLGTGEDPSKARWPTEVRELRRLHVVTPTPAGRIVLADRRLPNIAWALATRVLLAIRLLPGAARHLAQRIVLALRRLPSIARLLGVASVFAIEVPLDSLI